MEHRFNVNVAKKLGERCAIILANIMHWVQSNKAEGVNLHDGYYWTFNSIKAFEKLFPYMTSRQIRYALDKLIEEGYILSANFNKGCSRTLWYTYTQKALDTVKEVEPLESIGFTENKPSDSVAEVTIEEPFGESNVTKLSYNNDRNVNTNLQNCQNEFTKLSNDTNNKPQIINTNNKQAIEREINKEKEQRLCLSLIDFWNSQGLLKHELLTSELEKSILSCLKIYTFEQLCEYIRRYALVLNNAEYFWSHKWSLQSFLTQKNALPDFVDNGQKWLAYKSWMQKGPSPQPPEARMLRNNLTKEQISALMTDLDTAIV